MMTYLASILRRLRVFAFCISISVSVPACTMISQDEVSKRALVGLFASLSHEHSNQSDFASAALYALEPLEHVSVSGNGEMERELAFALSRAIYALQEKSVLSIGPNFQELVFDHTKQKVFSLSEDERSIIIRDLESAETILEIDTDQTIDAIAHSTADAVLAVKFPAGSIALLNSDTGQTLFEIQTDLRGVRELIFSPDGSMLAIEGRYLNDNSIINAEVWSISNGLRISELIGHRAAIHRLSFSSDSLYILTGSSDGTARLWSSESGEQIRQFQSLDSSGTRTRVVDAKFLFKKRQIVTAHSDRALRIWSMDNSSSPIEVRKNVADAEMINVHVSFDEKMIAVRDHFGSQILLANGKSIRNRGGTYLPRPAVLFSPNNEIYVQAEDRNIYLSPVPNPSFSVNLSGHQDSIFDLDILSHRAELVSSSEDRTIRTWTLDQQGTVGKLLPFAPNGFSKILTMYSPNGKYILQQVRFGTSLAVLDAKNGETVCTLDVGNARIVRAEFDPTGSLIVAATNRGEVNKFRAEDCLILDQFSAIGQVASAVAIGRKGLVAAAYEDGTVTLWKNPGIDESVELKGHNEEVTRAIFVEEDKFLVTVSEDGTVRLWSTGAGEPLRIFRGHEFMGQLELRDGGNSVSISPSGLRVAVANRDGAVSFFDTLSGSKEFTLPKTKNRLVTRVAMGPKGRFILMLDRNIVGAAKESIVLWDIVEAKPVRVLTFPGRLSGSSLRFDDLRFAFFDESETKLFVSGPPGMYVFDTETGLISQRLGEKGSLLAVSPDMKSFISAYGGQVKLRPLFDSLESMAKFARNIVPRCLSSNQRSKMRFDSETPSWCSGLPQIGASIDE